MSRNAVPKCVSFLILYFLYSFCVYSVCIGQVLCQQQERVQQLQLHVTEADDRVKEAEEK